MRAILLLLATLLLAAPLVAPPAAATSCTTGEPSLDPVVCPVVLLPFCAGEALGEASPYRAAKEAAGCVL
ncbi:MAG TPA: hypothetical protein VHH36_09380 [Candidatus Thermoplasmatota archaeon]|nr:hypothetical protein [Candidatus Thermoplasmatota archaeon]